MRVLSVAGFALLVVAAPCIADQNDPRLDTLFERLQAVEAIAQARRIERTIKVIWRRTENDRANTWLGKAQIDMFRGDYEESLAAIDKAIEAAPEFAEAWNRRAVVFYLMGDYQGALPALERTLALEPRHFPALSELGAIYMILGDDEAAFEALDRALEINPHLTGARRNYETVRRRLHGEPA